MAFVSVTRLHVASLWSYPPFIAYSLAAARQAKRTPGFHGGWLGNDAERGFWTCTVWENAAAMRAFRNSAVHMKAMPKLLQWSDEASYTHWEQPEAAIPAAEIAYARLADAGTLSKLRSPSRRQQEGLRVGSAQPRIGQRLTPVVSAAPGAVG